MRHQLIKPKCVLKRYVDYYFIFENDTELTTNCVDVFPSPGTSMIFVFGSNDIHFTSEKDKILKPCADFAIDTFVLHKRKFVGPKDLGILIVCFKPWAIHNFVPFHIKEAPNQRIDLKDIYPSKIDQLEEELGKATSDSERIAVTETFLLSIFKEKHIGAKILKAHSIIKQSIGMVPVYDIAKKIDLSEKQFNRNFMESTGISPKLYSRLERFYYAVMKMKQDHESLTSIALDSGYFDQAHFINEFKKFTQITPKQYLNNQNGVFFGHPLE
ncbi:MAG: AraC family transcriptional regulator [Gelidibacter sp.]